MNHFSRHVTAFWLRNFLIVGQIVVWFTTRNIWNIIYPSSVLTLSGMYFLINILFWLTRKNSNDWIFFFQLLIDIVELSLFFYLTGGSSNPFTWFLLIPIIFSATTLRSKHTWLLTLSAVISYTLLIKFFQPVSMEASMHHNHHQTSFSQHLIGMWLGFIVIALLLSWVILGLVNNIRRKDSQLMLASLNQAKNDKILALATLATGSAHELGTPLATINIIIKEMLNNPQLIDFHKQLKIMESQVYRCKDSLTQITASTGTTQAIKGKKLTVGKFIEKVLNSIHPPESVQLETKICEVTNQQQMISDKTLVQALVNIINNSFQAESTKVVLKSEISFDELNFIIIDNGKGLDEEFGKPIDSDKEFGMGLGLFLAHATIQRFSGSVNVKSVESSGTQIVISLPILRT